MRANTSLIGHILGSHPQICGYYEMHLSYKNQQDLLAQEQLYLKQETTSKNAEYLFDKLLHNDYQLLPKKICQEPNQQLKILVSLRPAEQTLKSIINLFQKKNNNHPYADPVNATQYYIKRLKLIADFCKTYPNSYYYYDADMLRNDSETTLKKLTQWLELTSPLSSEYQCFSKTGQERAGDSSANIKQGKIIKQVGGYDEINIDSNLLVEAEECFLESYSAIIKYAMDSLTDPRPYDLHST